MSKRIKLHTFNVLFQLFAYLADKTGGWRMFVHPKMLLGSLILGLGLASSMPINAQTQLKKGSSSLKKSSIKSNGPIVTCYEKVTEPIDTANIVFDVVQQMPQFPGGDIALMNFLEKHIKYPSNESLSNTNGKVICGFIVNKDGSISDITIYRRLDPILDSIAIKAIKAMPKFIPGMHLGKTVRVRYTLPIIFRTQE